jgi:hypothetical protein
MADQSSGGSNNFLYFGVGALVVLVGILAYVYFHGRGSSDVHLKVEVPKVQVDKGQH